MSVQVKAGDRDKLATLTAAINETGLQKKNVELWKGILPEILARHHVLSGAIAFHRGQIDPADPRAPDSGPAAAFELASVDVFVEKAQHLLEKRSRGYYRYAVLAVIATISIIVAAVFFLAGRTAAWEAAALHAAGASDAVGVTVFVFKSLGTSAVVLALIYFSASLARAFLHEGTIIDNRIHSLRFGRLYIYLKYGTVDSAGLEKLRGSLKVSDLEDAFGWNIETSTAFKDIRTELMARNALIGTVDSLSRLLKEFKGMGEPAAGQGGETSQAKITTG